MAKSLLPLTLRPIYIKLARALDHRKTPHLTAAEAKELVRDYEQRNAIALRNGHWAMFEEEK